MASHQNVNEKNINEMNIIKSVYLFIHSNQILHCCIILGKREKVPSRSVFQHLKTADSFDYMRLV